MAHLDAPRYTPRTSREARAGRADDIRGIGGFDRLFPVRNVWGGIVELARAVSLGRWTQSPSAQVEARERWGGSSYRSAPLR